MHRITKTVILGILIVMFLGAIPVHAATERHQIAVQAPTTIKADRASMTYIGPRMTWNVQIGLIHVPVYRQWVCARGTKTKHFACGIQKYRPWLQVGTRVTMYYQMQGSQYRITGLGF